VRDPEVLVEVSDLLAALRAGVARLEVNKLGVGVMVRLLVCPVIAVFAGIPEGSGNNLDS
jgi:hypothetical protein